MWYNIKIWDCVVWRDSLAKTLKLSVRSVRTALEHLKSTNEVTIKTTNKFSIITVIWFDKYQTQEIKTTKKTTSKTTNNRPSNDQQPTTLREEEEGKKEKNNIYTEDFEKFWIIYPKKKGKWSAYKNWLIATKVSPPAEILAGATKYAEECRHLKTEDNFIKRPQGWLSDERWWDEYKTPTIDKQKALEDYHKKQERKERGFITNLFEDVTN
jgi:hypothetical protein